MRDIVLDNRHLLGRHILGIGSDHPDAEFLGFVLDVLLEADEERVGQRGDRQADDDLLLAGRPAAQEPEAHEQRRRSDGGKKSGSVHGV